MMIDNKDVTRDGVISCEDEFALLTYKAPSGQNDRHHLTYCARFTPNWNVQNNRVQWVVDVTVDAGLETSQISQIQYGSETSKDVVLETVRIIVRHHNDIPEHEKRVKNALEEICREIEELSDWYDKNLPPLS
ncbi:MAG: hypothetical protein OXN19_21605 [Caldilineaceae bacterium]|nr:hypothetical protein [Caldilineaceae bacterium]